MDWETGFRIALIAYFRGEVLFRHLRLRWLIRPVTEDGLPSGWLFDTQRWRGLERGACVFP